MDKFVGAGHENGCRFKAMSWLSNVGSKQCPHLNHIKCYAVRANIIIDNNNAIKTDILDIKCNICDLKLKIYD